MQQVPQLTVDEVEPPNLSSGEPLSSAEPLSSGTPFTNKNDRTVADNFYS